MVPFIGGQFVADYLDQVDEGGRYHLSKALVTDVGDKKANDIHVYWHNIGKLLIELIQESCKSLNDGLECLLVERNIGIVLRTFLVLDRKLDILEDRVHHLGEDFSPKQERV